MADDTLLQKNKPGDRRRGPDIILRTVSFVGAAGWAVMVVAMIVVHKARPPLQTVASKSAQVHVRTTWADDLTQVLLYLMFAGLFLSFSGLLFNIRRLRRKDDQVRINLIIMFVLSAAGVLSYYFFLQ